MTNEFPGVYCTEHIVFIVSFFLLSAAGSFLVRRFAKGDKARTAVVKLSAAVLLVMIIANRVSIVAELMRTAPAEHSWLELLPNSFCGLASLVYALTVLLGKDDNAVLHFIVYFGFLGGLATLFYPDFLNTQTFWDIRSFTGLAHHALMVWMSTLLFVTGKFRPSPKRWFVYPLGFCLVMVLGLFEKEALGFESAMNIGKPLVGSLPVLTSWYVLMAASSVAAVLVSLFGKKKKGGNE